MASRRWLVPEQVQTSGMDCGPASLTCLLRGFGLQANYGRLRDACQTDVDGTSIDTMEEIAVALGLEGRGGGNGRLSAWEVLIAQIAALKN